MSYSPDPDFTYHTDLVESNPLLGLQCQTPLVITGTSLSIKEASATDSGVINTNTQTFTGVKTFTSPPVCASTPSTSGQLTNKGYVDQLVKYNLSWQAPIISFYDFTIPPSNPSDGDRYVASTNTVSGVILANDIVTWDANSSSWIAIAPKEGYCLHNNADTGFFVNQNMTFNGTQWINIGSTACYGNLIGKPNQDLNTDSSVAFTKITVPTLQGDTTLNGSLTSTGAVRSYNNVENLVQHTGALSLTNISGTHRFVGDGDVNVHLIAPTDPLAHNGLKTTIINNKGTGNLKIYSSSGSPLLTNLSVGGVATMTIQDVTFDALHMWTQPNINIGIAPYWAGVFINNSSGYRLGQSYVIPSLKEYTMTINFAWAGINYASPTGGSVLCIGPLVTPLLTGSVDAQQIVMVKSTNLGIVQGVCWLGGIDSNYLYIRPYAAVTFPAGDNYMSICYSSFTYLVRVGEY